MFLVFYSAVTQLKRMLPNPAEFFIIKTKTPPEIVKFWLQCAVETIIKQPACFGWVRMLMFPICQAKHKGIRVLVLNTVNKLFTT